MSKEFKEKVLTALFKSEHESHDGKVKITRSYQFSLDGKQIVMKGNILDHKDGQTDTFYELPEMRLSDATQLRNLKSMLEHLLMGGTLSSG